MFRTHSFLSLSLSLVLAACGRDPDGGGPGGGGGGSGGAPTGTAGGGAAPTGGAGQPTAGTGAGTGGGQPGADTTPDAFSFTAQTNVAVDTLIESNAVTLAGIDAPSPVGIDGGEYSIDGGAYVATAGTIDAGQSIKVRVRSSATPSTAAMATLAIGGVSAAFSVTTAAEGDMPPPASQDWPMFGRDYSNTRASIDTTIGAAQVPAISVVERVTGAGVTSTAALVEGKVYYSDFAGWLKAVDALTGAAVWSKKLQAGMLTPSPFVSADSVYVGGEGSTVYAVNRANGDLKWSKKIEDTPYNRIWSSAIVIEDTLLIGAASYQVFFPTTPTFRGSVVGLNAKTGEEKWRFSVCPVNQCGGGVSVWSSVAVDPATKTAFIGTGQAYSQPAGPYSDALIALNYETGERVWHYQITPNDIYTINGGSLDRDVGAAPNLFEATIDGMSRKLVGVGDKGGHYTAVDRVTGELVWQRRVDLRNPPGSPIGGVMGTPAVANGRIYLVNNTSINGTGRFDARPATGTAFALDAATGEVLWSLQLPAGSFSGNAVANGLLYFVTWDGQLRIVDANTGMLLRSLPLGTQVGSYDDVAEGFPNGSTSGPVIANGYIYAGYGWTWGGTVQGGLAILDAK
jgi:polyvinyl alcohol dehydrogenase (cytochrome)